MRVGSIAKRRKLVTKNGKKGLMDGLDSDFFFSPSSVCARLCAITVRRRAQFLLSLLPPSAFLWVLFLFSHVLSPFLFCFYPPTLPCNATARVLWGLLIPVGVHSWPISTFKWVTIILPVADRLGSVCFTSPTLWIFPFLSFVLPWIFSYLNAGRS